MTTLLATAERRRSGAVAMMASAAFWGIGTVASKAVIDQSRASASTMLVVQLVGSVGALTIAAGVLRQSPVGLWRHGWIGMLEPGLAFQFGLAGLTITSAASASVIGSLEPIAIPIVAWVLFRHRLTRRQLGTTLLAAFGAVLVAWAADGHARHVNGDVLVLLGVAVAGVYVVLSERFEDNAPVVALTAVQHTYALALTVVITAALSPFISLQWPVGWWIMAAAGTGILSYAMPFALFLFAVQRLPAVEAGMYLTLIPVFGVAGAVVLLGERITALQLIGSAVVMSALAGAHRSAAPVEPNDRNVTPYVQAPVAQMLLSHCEPDQELPDHVEPDHVLPDQVEPDQVEPDQVLPDQLEPDHVEPDQVEPDHVPPDHVDPFQVPPDQVLPCA
jgi:drug/metabolite transporter (DMT)-like permease